MSARSTDGWSPQADKYGTLVTTIDLKLDRATRDVVSAKADNTIVRTATLAKDPEQTALIAVLRQGCRADRQPPAGTMTETLSRDAQRRRRERARRHHRRCAARRDQRQANGGAVIAFTNPGGVRTDIARKEDGAVTYADIFASQPFRNQLVTLTLTGKQIKDMLEQQWLDPKRPRILQVSRGFCYAWDAEQGAMASACSPSGCR